MKDKKLKRLSRAELLELLLEQTRETEQLQEKLDELQAQLESKDLKIREAGDLAHAVLAVNQVMEAAQQAAQQYLDNMKLMEEETRRKCDEMLRSAAEEARQLRQQDASKETAEHLLTSLHEILDEQES